MSNIPKKKHKLISIIPSDDYFLRIFLPMIDDEEQRRLEALNEKDADLKFSSKKHLGTSLKQQIFVRNYQKPDLLLNSTMHTG